MIYHGGHRGKPKLRRRHKNTGQAAPLDPAKARERVFARAAKLLAAKPRSVAELRERLLEGRGATKTNVDQVIERLREYGYLDDAKFAQSYASNRVQQRPIGRRRLQRDLWLRRSIRSDSGSRSDRPRDRETCAPARQTKDTRRGEEAFRSFAAPGVCI